MNTNYTSCALIILGSAFAPLHAELVFDVFNYGLNNSVAVDFEGSAIDDGEDTQPINPFPSEWGTLNLVSLQYEFANGQWAFSADGSISVGNGDAGQILNGPIVGIRFAISGNGYTGFTSGLADSGLFSVSSETASGSSGLLDVEHLSNRTLGPQSPSGNFTSNSISDLEWFALMPVHAKNNSPATGVTSFGADLTGRARLIYDFTPSQAYFDADSPDFVPGAIPEPAAVGVLFSLAALLIARRRLAV